MKPRMSVARCCCPTVGPNQLEFTQMWLGDASEDGSRFNQIVWVPFLQIEYPRNGHLVGTSTDVNAWWLLESIPIAQGTTITNARVEWATAFSNANSQPFANIPGTARASVHLEDADTTSIPASAADFNGRTRTAASTAHVLSTNDVAAGTTLSVNITGQLNTVVNRAGWVSGNNILIIFDDDGSDNVIGPPHEMIYVHYYPEDEGSPFGPDIRLIWST